MMGPDYLLAFSTGLFGGFGHCIGMCGPLVASYALHSAAGPQRIFPHLMYNAGRITTYSCIGSLMGLTGTFVNTAGRLAGIQNAAGMITGVVMIVMGLGIVGLFRSAGFIERHNGALMKAVKVVIETDSPWRYYPLGLLLGFLPCGLSYSIFIGAAGTGGLLQGTFFTLCFGLGTVPALLLFGFVMGYLSAVMRGLLYRVSGIGVILSGVYFLVRGIATRA